MQYAAPHNYNNPLNLVNRLLSKFYLLELFTFIPLERILIIITERVICGALVSNSSGKLSLRGKISKTKQ